jgi:thiamine biosynthesis lipoprotein
VTRAASFRAWGTSVVIAVTDARALPSARATVDGLLERVGAACSRFTGDSELSRANARAGTAVGISALLAELVGTGLEAARSTEGLVDPTLGTELRAAGYDRTWALVRTRDSWALRPVAPRRATWRDVELDRDRLLLTVPRGLELDLGATAKAWTADAAAHSIAKDLGAGTLVSLGGDVAVAGPPPTDGWAVRIADDHAAPLDTAGPVVAVAEGGLATSGTAVRRWHTDQGTAHHVIDPRTGRPADTPWRTVTVAAGSCLAANTASTAALVLGQAAPAWLGEQRLPARLVREDGTPTLTGGWPAEAEAA